VTSLHRISTASRRATGLLGAAVVVLGLSLQVPQAVAAGDIGYKGLSFAGAGEAPTADKPQSKLWFHDNSWWADMFDTASKTWHIFRLDRAKQKWTDTGTRIDDRASTRADALWDGTHLYVASNVLAESSSVNVAGKPARLYRYSYDTGARTFTLDSGFPVAINDYSSESLSLAKDKRGVLWATWTQNKKVYINSTDGTDSSWGKPFVPDVSGASDLKDDDISAVSAYGKSAVGVMWSNQKTSAFYFASHSDDAGRTSWTGRTALSDPGVADDHINLTQLEGDESSGRLFAAVKTSLDTEGSDSAAQNLVLGLNLSTGKWDKATFGTFADCHTRPKIVIDGANQTLHVFATAPSSGDGQCPHPGTAGTVYEKTTPVSKLSFPSGRGTPVIRDADSAGMNNPTGTKQNITPASGLIVLASNDETQRYWHADIPLSGSDPGGSPVSHAGATTTGQAEAVTDVTLDKPAGTTTGDVLVAAFTTDLDPDVTAPDGWNPLADVHPSGASVFGYYRVVTDADSQTSSWTWKLSSAQKWSGGMSRYQNVDTSHPLDTNVSTAVKNGSSSITVPAVTTTVAGAAVIGAMGTDSGKVTVTAPSGWTEAWQTQTGQLSESAYYLVASKAGSSVSATWTQSKTVSMGAWIVALRPKRT
jgi:hypothetical protein